MDGQREAGLQSPQAELLPPSPQPTFEVLRHTTHRRVPVGEKKALLAGLGRFYFGARRTNLTDDRLNVCLPVTLFF